MNTKNIIEINIGDTYGVSKVLEYINSKGKGKHYLCECSCGNKHIKRGSDLKRIGRNNSCGKCGINRSVIIKEGDIYFGYKVIRELPKRGNNRRCLVLDQNGFHKDVSLDLLVKGKLKKEIDPKKTHGLSYSRFYSIYRGMLKRCNNKNATNYNRYGGRGIQCLWDTFEAFKKDMYESYLEHCKKFGEKETTIDRIDNDGNYYKENCRWATKKEQASNREIKTMIPLEFKGLTIVNICKKFNVDRKTFYRRIKKGLSFYESLGIQEP